MTGREIVNAVRRARRGDKEALRLVAKESDALAKETNQRMQELEEHGYDYYAYNLPANFAYSEYDHANRLKTSRSKYLKNDVDAMYKQIKIARAFLNKRSSTLEGQKEIFQERVDTWKSRGYFGSYMRNGKLVLKSGGSEEHLREFFRFLANQEFDTLNDYGESDVIVEAVFRAWNSKTVGPERVLEIFREHLESGKGADELVNELIGHQRGGTFSELLKKRGYFNR